MMQALRCQRAFQTQQRNVQCPWRATPRRTALVCAAAPPDTNRPHSQLATAKLPKGIDQDRFTAALYQRVASLTQTGNYPFVLPLKVDALPGLGFILSLLRRGDGGQGFGSAADLVATVEDVPNEGAVLFVRFYEGPMANAGRRSPPSGDAQQRLETLLGSLVDVDTLMSAMPNAIKSAVAVTRPQ